MKKVLLLVLVFSLGIGLFNISYASGPVSIRMSNWLEMEAATQNIFKQMIAEFEKQNPKIKVETVGIPFNQYKDQVLIMNSSGDAPDVIMGNSQMMVAFNGAKALAPLKGLLSSTTIADIFPNNLQGTTFNGEVKAISWAPHPIALFYNKELFKQAGLDPEKPPATWEQMIDYAKKIAALGKDRGGNKIYGLAIASAKVAHAGTVFNGIIYSYGGYFLDKKGKVALNNSGTKEAFTFIKLMIDQGIAPAGIEQKDVRGLFAGGQVGMVFDGDMGRGAFRTISGKGTDFDQIMGVTIVPIGKTGASETVFTDRNDSYSKHQKEAAALVEFLLSKKAMVMYHQDQAVLSARKSIAALPEMNEDDYMKVFNKQSETARPLPATNPMFDNAMLEMTKALERVTVGKEDVGKVLAETEAKIKALYQE